MTDDTPRRPKIEYAIACDDIRQERNGKYILIGVYAADYVPAALPAHAQLMFGLFVALEEAGDYALAVELLMEGSATLLAKARTRITIGEPTGRALLALPLPPIILAAPGTLVLRHSEDQVTIMTLKISPPDRSIT